MILGTAVLSVKVSTRAAISLVLQRNQQLPVTAPPFPSPRRLLPQQQWVNNKICHKSQIRMISTTTNYPDTPTPVTDGTLIARILPREYVEYERLKPSKQRILPVDAWRQRIVWPDLFWSEYHNHHQQGHRHDVEAPEKTDDLIVMLNVQIRTSFFDPQLEQFQLIKARMALQRDSTESALRTLRRLEVSSKRKLEHAKNRLSKTSQRRTSSSNSSAVDDSDTSILVLEPNISGDCPEYEEDDMDGYRRLAITDEVLSMELWQSLMHKSKTRLWMDVLPEKEAGITLDVESCPPTLLYIHTFEDFNSEVFVGVPLVIETKAIHSDHTLMVWFANDEQVCFNSYYYTPTDDDVGKRITVVISPLHLDRLTGYEEVYEFQKLVSKRPCLPILSLRSSWLAHKIQPRPSNELRVLSYNLMADIHLSPEVERRANYAGCKVESLTRTRRIPLLLYEILQHQADIICLQECDATVYEQLLRPALHAHGYSGFYSNKATSQLEGCAMFWSTHKFSKDAEMKMYPLRDLFQDSPQLDQDWTSTPDMHNFLDQVPDLQQVVQENVGQIVQVARLKLNHNAVDRDQNPLYLVVGNTHLFYHPLADHVRLLQTFVICKVLDQWCRNVSHCSCSSTNDIKTRRRRRRRRHPLILCGDLNSDPASGAVQLLLHRKVNPHQYDTWKNLDTYRWEGGDSYFESEYLNYENNAPVQEAQDVQEEKKEDRILAKTPFDDSVPWSVQPPIIQLPDTFPQLQSAYDPMPEFSNYVVGFTETLDYIFLSQRDDQCPSLKVTNSAPVPSLSEMQQYPAIPNEDYPSDHVSLACDLKWDYE